MAENKELALVLRLVADQFQSELKNSQGALGQFNNFVKDWRTQLAAAGAALFAVAKSAANYGDELFKTSQKVGIQVEALAGLQYAAKLADVDNRQLQTGLQALSRAMVDSAQGVGEGKEAFDRIGVSATDANGKLRPMQAVLLELADVFSRSADGAGKTEVAMKLLGKSGADLIPLLNSGKASILEYMAEARRLGLVMSEDDAKAAEEFNDALGRLDARVKGLTVAIGLPLTRVLTDAVAMFQELEVGIKRAGDEMAGFSTHLSQNFGNTGVGQGLIDLFSAMGFGHRTGEAPGPAERFFQDMLGFKSGQSGRDVQLDVEKKQIPSTGDEGGKRAKDAAKEQEQLGKALLEIYLAQNRALEIRNKLQGGQGQLSEFFLAFDRQQQFRQEDEAAEQRKGQLIVDQTRMQVQLRDAALQRERDGLIENLQAWIAYDNQVGASTELRLEHQLDLVRANLAKQLQLTNEQAGQLITAWQNVDSQTQDQILNQTQLNGQERITIELQTLTQLAAIHQQFSGDIFQGWTLGLQRYLQDTQSAFGFAADMARRTAQQMEGAFRTFFFDLMDEKITSLKDVFESFANFAKQMIAQVMAQLATTAVLNGLKGGFGLGGFGSGLSDLFGGGGFGAAQTPLFGFANGGPVLGAGNSDSVRAMLTPGEGVLTRKGMQTLALLNSGTVPAAASPNVVVNFHGVQPGEVPQVNYRRQFEGMVVDVILRNRDLHGMLGMAR
ncbi:MAG: hypothetical protein MRJ68_17675 [Nitrospira sp.]|nr:hypothetical protein [Nitrospira sp.]